MRHRHGRYVLLAVVALATALCVAGAVAAGDADPYRQIRTREFGTADEAFETVQKQVEQASADDYPSIEARLIDVIEDPDATAAGKQFACRMLRIVGSQKCVPAVSELLTDERLSHMARWVLHGMEGRAVDRALRRALSRAEGRVRIGLIETIGQRADAGALAQLSGLLESRDRLTAQAALRAVGKVGTAGAADALERADVAKSLATDWCDAYLNCAEKLSETGEKARAQQMLQRLLEGDYPALARAAAFGELVEAQQADAIPRVLETLRSDEPELRKAAAQAVLEIKGERATRLFARQLPELPPASQATLLGVLAARGQAEALTPVINDLVDSDDERVRMAAINALVSLGDVSSVDPVAGALAEGGEVARAARRTLLNLQADGVAGALVEQAKSGRAAVRAGVIEVLADRGISQSIPVLYDAARDDDTAVRRAAVKALGRLGGPDDLPRLVKMLLDPEYSGQRNVLEQSIISIAGRMDDRSARTRPAIRALSEADTEVTLHLLSILRSLGGQNALQAVRRHVRSDDDQIKRAAVRALSRWPSSAPMDDLLELAQQADDRGNRILALRGYIHMIGEADLSSDRRVALYRRAMDLASRAEERRMVLAGMAELAHPEALQTVEKYLEDPDLKGEAVQAYTGIAAGIAGSHPGQARPALKWVVKYARNDSLRRRAREVLNQMDRFKGRITAWELAGPYTRGGQGGTELFNVAFPPEKESQQADWQTVNVGPEGVVYLDRMIGGNNRVAYLRSTVIAPAAQNARLEVGSDDGVRVWVNGEVVLEANTERAFDMPQNRTDIRLRKGENAVLLKVTQAGGQWAACARIVKPNGRPIEGLTWRVK